MDKELECRLDAIADARVTVEREIDRLRKEIEPEMASADEARIRHQLSGLEFALAEIVKALGA